MLKTARVLLHPNVISPGFVWTVSYLTMHRGIPTQTWAEHGRVDDPADPEQISEFMAACVAAARDCS